MDGAVKLMTVNEITLLHYRQRKPYYARTNQCVRSVVIWRQWLL